MRKRRRFGGGEGEEDDLTKRKGRYADDFMKGDEDDCTKKRRKKEVDLIEGDEDDLTTDAMLRRLGGICHVYESL
eukprot:CAMPEP_0179474844 /NCGR_PEP_ID=MMETSP0799-20121207/54195_1 /TAXON_ID=46947 /ORGANISM="Geminigera cryophila, Strain CCMP2564" /LENGTH=74 /DNA_ID=CAMNT_0021284103 /DNA_START=88 /DNA_END=310 /DNA_ORIENTATION=-